MYENAMKLFSFILNGFKLYETTDEILKIISSATNLGSLLTGNLE